ncbi:MAG: bifunctional enoyl-CoA hydratase/phosphate acetyltransferase [Planctomycetota bacterium]
MPSTKHNRIGNLDDLVATVKRLRRKPVLAVAAAEDDAVLKSISVAMREGIAEPALFGDAQKIKRLARSLRISLQGVKIVSEPDPTAATLAAVKMCRAGEAQILMKGLVSTAVVLKAVLDRENGLTTGRILSHAAVFYSPRIGRLMILTDAGVNINPDIGRKVEIIRNAIALAKCLGIARPKVAALAAVETIKPDMTATTDAAILTQMSLSGQFGDVIVAGPYALDLALSLNAAKHKNVRGPVAGKADILLAPDIEAGNILYKSLVYFAGLEIAPVVLGATAPIIVTSRSDSSASKLYAIALAAFMANDE